MSSFIITLSKPNKEVRTRVQDSFDNYFFYSETVFLVTSAEPIKEIAELAGIEGNHRVPDSSGFVAKLNGSYAGFTKVTLWDWLDETKQLA